MNRTVLCVVEFEHYPEDVVARAAWLARLHGADLELVLSDPSMNYLGENFVYFADLQLLMDSVKDEQQEVLEHLSKLAESQGVKVRASTSHDRPEAHMIADKAKDCDALFVVKGTHWHSPTERASLADTDWRLIRRLSAPLWFAKPVEWKESPTIVAAVDPTHSRDKRAVLDRKIIEGAQAIADKCDGKVLLLHTYQRLEEIGSRVTWRFKPEKLPIDDLDEKIREEHSKVIEALADECGVDKKAVHQLPGRAHELLPTFARANNASLVVMGGLARSGIKKRFVGSTAARVLDHLPCDMLIVRA
ncbi:MAG: universal stress protein [Gammaproteobacteria bacterium]|nr:universal stress protein [Gammaproteobacteria bacterium]